MEGKLGSDERVQQLTDGVCDVLRVLPLVQQLGRLALLPARSRALELGDLQQMRMGSLLHSTSMTIYFVAQSQLDGQEAPVFAQRVLRVEELAEALTSERGDGADVQVHARPKQSGNL